MGYLHIENLYKPTPQKLLAFRELYVLEKIHGTSAHVGWNKEGQIRFFAGGCNDMVFRNIFGTELPHPDTLTQTINERLRNQEVVIYGEAYGGKLQGMKNTYGDKTRFIAFDVSINDKWLAVHDAAQICERLGIPFVWYTKCEAHIDVLTAFRNQPSQQAKRNGILEDRKSEGIVIRPLFEVTLNNGERLIAKYKNDDFAERKTKQVDPQHMIFLEDANEVAEEWVTDMRLEHVLDKLGNPNGYEDIPRVIKAMIEDVMREGQGEFEVTDATPKAIGKKTVELFKKRIRAIPADPT